METMWKNHGIWGVRILTQHCVNGLIPYKGFERNLKERSS